MWLEKEVDDARLVLFHKIHYGLEAVNMPLELKYNSGPTRTKNSGISYSSIISWLSKKFIHSSTLQLYSQRIGIVLLMTLFIHCSLSTSGITSYHQLYLRYSTNSGERESRPFLDEPETSVYFNQHYSSALGLFCYVLPTRLPTGTGQESSICWRLTILRRRKRRHDVTWQKYNQLSTEVNFSLISEMME